MIAIPNTDMPKDCESCEFLEVDGAFENTEFGNEWQSVIYCRLLDKPIGDGDKRTDCPLIEIVRCGECIHHDDGLCHRPKWSFAVEPTDFCSYGEPRENR